jgi:outer membrane protein OmpA-like peptidoglycan-associated protein
VNNYMDIRRILPVVMLCLLMVFFLQGCASSNITREANDNATVGYQRSATNLGSAGNGSMVDSFSNSSQMAKGAVIGGAAGALVGGLTSGVGLVPGLAEGAILGGAYGAYVDSNTTLADRLLNRGVKVIEIGDHLMLVMYSNQLFHAMTPVIRPGAYSTLDLVAEYINSYTTMSVRVAAYTSDGGNEAVIAALSKEQAGSVVRYLWRRGVNTRMLTAAGMGGTNLVDHNSSRWEGLNYRIEITMEKLPTSGTIG